MTDTNTNADNQHYPTDDDRFEYTRRRANVQVGDGPDQRGEITIETFRRYDPEAGDRQFAEWYLELERATKALREELGLPAPDDPDDVDVDVEVGHE